MPGIFVSFSFAVSDILFWLAPAKLPGDHILRKEKNHGEGYEDCNFHGGAVSQYQRYLNLRADPQKRT